MRNMTEAERELVYGSTPYRCCFCPAALTPGPRGGMSINMKCPDCGAVVNVIAPEHRAYYGDGIKFFGQVLREPAISGT